MILCKAAVKGDRQSVWSGVKGWNGTV